ncbi:phage tail protein [Halomonas elongata]|uniref:phage tail-collar fiber domain-containing protein n=1 Tax=Halomonas elongata TaxID=2746 RepID=UPI00255B2C69|nr:phage tail protein [Halomonas elongata]MDL4863274.1 phage tail protein [Halomonas elongata]
MALNLTVTDAGRAEIINASNTGTAQVTVTHVALGRAGYQPTPDQTTLQDEIKRVDTIAGDVVADDTISVTVKDEGADAYTVREVGLISDQGTLLAVAAQDAVIIEKTSDATLLLVSDLVLKDLDANSVTFGDVVFINPPATETVKGVVELADTGEATAGDDDQRAMTPVKVHQAFQQYGLGTRANLSDLHTDLHIQFGRFGVGAMNKPFENAAGAVWRQRWGDEAALQIALLFYPDSHRGRLYSCTQKGGAWGAWEPIYSTAFQGAGSGLDADMVDGIQGSEILTNEGTQTIILKGEKEAVRILKSSQNPDATAGLLLTADNDGGQLDVAFELRGAPDATGIDESAHNNSAHTRFVILGSGETLIGYSQLEANGYSIGSLPGGAMLAVNGPIAVQGHVVWHAGNMGPGSGLNADMLDGQHSGYYRNANNLNAGTVPLARLPMGAGNGLDADKLDGLQGKQFLRSDQTGEIDAGNNAQVLRLKRSGATANQVVLAFTYSDQETTVSKFLGIHNGDLKLGGSANLASGGKRVFHEGFMGPSSGLNADMVDGKHANQFLRSDASNRSVPLENKEWDSISEDGELFWDKSSGIYIKSSNAKHARAALAWTSANFTAGSGLSVDYDSEDHPTLSIPQGPASGLNADLLDGYHAHFFRDAGNLINGTLPKGRLTGTYNINIEGSADQLDGKHASSFARSDAPTRFDVGRGVVDVENHVQDNQDGAGITLRTSNNPGKGSPGGDIGSIFAVRSSGDALRLWVGQSVTSTGDNDFETKKITATGPIYAQGNQEVYHPGNLSPVETSRQINTGTGLTGGGNLGSNRTLSIASSGLKAHHFSNACIPQSAFQAKKINGNHIEDGGIWAENLGTGGSMGHWVAERTATRGIGWLGTYAFLECLSETNPGVNRAASALRYSSSYNGGTRGFGEGLSGTWKCMGRVKGGDSDGDDATLWLRIA